MGGTDSWNSMRSMTASSAARHQRFRKCLEGCILTSGMAHILARSIEILSTVLAVAGMGYFIAALLAARIFLAARRAPLAAFAPGVSLLKSLKGLDPGMIGAFRSHCIQSYDGQYELLFGVASLADPAVEAVHQLQAEFPERAIRLDRVPAAAGNQRQGQHAGSAGRRRPLRLLCSSTTPTLPSARAIWSG